MEKSFADFLHWTFGEIKIPLSCVIRESDTLPGMVLSIMRGKSCSEEHGSMERKIIMRASHTHPNFKEDNSKAYYYIKKTTRTTMHDASINP